jgi:adenylate kinase family enzyme
MDGMNFVFFGIIGSGKGTQIKLLMEHLVTKYGKEVVYAYPGNEYRKLVESGTYVGNLIKDSMHQGHLQPDFLTDAIFSNIVMASIAPEKHLIADGYPRTIVQSKTFDAITKFFDRKNIQVVYIQLGEEEAKKRNMLRGRHDDTEEGLKRRFEEYKNNVIPSMEYLKSLEGYTLHTINGEQAIEKVHEDIIKALNL